MTIWYIWYTYPCLKFFCYKVNRIQSISHFTYIDNSIEALTYFHLKLYKIYHSHSKCVEIPESTGIFIMSIDIFWYPCCIWGDPSSRAAIISSWQAGSGGSDRLYCLLHNGSGWQYVVAVTELIWGNACAVFRMISCMFMHQDCFVSYIMAVYLVHICTL